MVSRVNAALSGPLPLAVAKLRLYLPNPATHAILLKPVKSNIAEAHGQIAKLLQVRGRERGRAGITPILVRGGAIVQQGCKGDATTCRYGPNRPCAFRPPCRPQTEYQPEEAAEIPLHNPQQLAAVLEQL